MSKYPKLFIPGPTHVSDEILEEFKTPQIGHRTPEISKIISELVQGVQNVLYTNNHIYLVSHPATGLWEMAIRNSVKNKVLHCVNGAFSNKWAKVSDSIGVDYDILEYDWGLAVKAEDIERKLKLDHYDAVAIVHNETSTGAMSNIKEIGNMMKSFPDTYLLVDAVSSMAGIKIEVDLCEIDFILASTQKAWGLPAGFSIAAASDRFIKRSSEIDNKGYILDVNTYEKYYVKNQTPYTPSIPHLFGLKKVLDLIGKEGIERSFGRKFADKYNIHRTRTGFPNKGLDTFSNMARIGVYVIDRVIQEQIGGGINLEKDIWYIPNMGHDIIAGSKL